MDLFSMMLMWYAKKKEMHDGVCSRLCNDNGLLYGNTHVNRVEEYLNRLLKTKDQRSSIHIPGLRRMALLDDR